ncbi:putative Peroxidase [Trypanosoma vivax]|uniref:Plant heme peroxidase family profile domain-containing protein n=1 Tax=Trypanosoma vivax (strain Y486) TaxID=1055687 RepID=G0U537_TRYVY|nr:putative Peroxidase [Trypanosoma vivax]CCC50985.1 conserved hypothetical protein [Trypanosoma vivax Y486]
MTTARSVRLFAVWPRLGLIAQNYRYCSSTSPVKELRNRFRAPPNVGPGREGGPLGQDANPYKSWEHMNHKWLLLMCLGCLAGGAAAGNFAEVDEDALQPPYSISAIFADVTKTFEVRPDLAAVGIRVAFILAARRAGVSSDTFDESCSVARGLEDIAGVIQQLVTTYRISVEDASSLVAVAAVKFLNGPWNDIASAWRWGRNDIEEPLYRRSTSSKGSGSAGSMLEISTILESLGDLTAAECVALMACHSVGEFHEHVSGLDNVTHIGSRYHLSNEYFKFLLDNEGKFFDMEVPRTEENKEIKRLPKDFVCTYVVTGKSSKKKQCVLNRREVDALLGNTSWRAFVELFAADEAQWSKAFQSAFTKMIESNFKRLRFYKEPSK